MAKKERGKIGSKRTCTYTRPKTQEAGPSHRQPAEPSSSGSGYKLPNQSIYPNSPEPQSTTGTGSFMDNEPRPSGSGYGLPNQESYQDSPEPRSTIVTNPVVDNVSAEFYRSDASINIQRMHGVRASLLESFTVPSHSPPAMTANIAVVIASSRRRRSVEKSGDSESPKKGSGDTKPSPMFSQKKVNVKRMIHELENMSTPLSDARKFPVARKYRSTPLAQFMVEEDSVQQKSRGKPVKKQSDDPTILKRNPTGQVSVCETMVEELVPALNPPLSSIVPSSSMTRGGDGNAKEVEEEDSVQQRKTDKLVERQIGNNTSITNFEDGNASRQVSVCESSAEPVSAPNPPPSCMVAVPCQDNSESCSSPGRSTGGKMERKKSVEFQCPVARRCNGGGDGRKVEDLVQQRKMDKPVKRQSSKPTILKSNPTGQVSACESTKELVAALNPLPSSIVPSSSMTRGGDGNAREVEEDSVQQRKTDKLVERQIDNNTSITNFEEGNASGQVSVCESSAEPVSAPNPPPSSTVAFLSQDNSESCSSSECLTRGKKGKKNIGFQCPAASGCDDDGGGKKKRVQLETNISFPVSKIPKVTSTRVTSATTSSSDVFTFSPPIKNKIPVSIQSPSYSSTFQPSCFSMPTTSTESTETLQPIKSWTRSFKQFSRNTFKNSPSTSLTSAAHTSPKPFRIGPGKNTPPAPYKSSLFSSKKQVELETNINFPIPKIPKVTSTLVTSATTSSSDVFTFSPPIKIKVPVSIQSPSCSSREIIKHEPNLPKFTFSPATSVTRPSTISLMSEPITFDTSTSTDRFTRVTSNASTTLELFSFSNPIMVKSPILSQGSSLSTEEQVQPKFTFSPAAPITRRPPIYSSSNISSTAVTSSATTPCSITFKTEILSKGSASNPKKRVKLETNISFPIPKIPKVTSTRVTSATTSSSDVFTFSPPIKIKVPVSIQSPSCSSREIIKLEPNLPTFTFSPATSVTRSSTISLMPKPITFDTSTSTARFTQVTSNTNTTPELFNFSNPIMIKSPILSQGSALSTEKQVQPKFTFSPAASITCHLPIYSSSNISSKTMTFSVTTSCSITFKAGILSKGSASQATFQPSCFSMPTTSTAPIPIKSWTRPFKRSSRNTFKNSPSTSSTATTHTPPEPFRIGQGTNTPPAPSQNPLFSSTWQSSSFSMGQDSAGMSQQPSPYSAASNLDQQSSSPSSTGFRSVLPSMNPFPF